jgi:hypothetical protein
MRTLEHTRNAYRPRRVTRIAAVGMLIVGGLLLSSAAHAQQPRKVRSLKLKEKSVSRLQASQEWRKVLKTSGDTIRPQKGFKMVRAGNIIFITNESARVPDYQTMKQGVSSNAIRRGGDQCIVLKQICACASTLIDNMYGGNADDDCHFEGTASENTCRGATACCAYFDSEEPVECPEG